MDIKEKHRRQEKNSCFKPLWATIFIFMILTLTQLSIISALDFDNVITYSNNDLTAEIKDCSLWAITCLVDGESYGEVTLKSHKTVDEVKQVGLGDPVVMYYESPSWDKLSINNVEFTDVKTGESIEKDYTFVILVEEEYDYNIYEGVCDVNSCDRELVRVEKRTREVWKELDINNIPHGKQTIGIKVNSIEGDYIDGVWTIEGKKIKKHAVWSASLNAGIIGYWRFDDNLNEAINGTYNATQREGSEQYNSTYYMNGNYALDLGGDDSVNITGLPNPNAWAVGFWIYPRAVDVNSYAFTQQADTDNTFMSQFNTYFRVIMGGVTLNCNDIAVEDAWEYVVIQANSVTQNLTIYRNGVQCANNIGSYDGSGRSEHTKIGGRSGVLTNAIYDEVSYYGRELTGTEITSLYDGGVGSFYPFPDTSPTVNLTYPADTYLSDIALIDFNCTANDDRGILNLSLMIDGIRNYTIFNTTAGENLSLATTLSMADGGHNWTCEAYDSGDQGTIETNRTLTIDTIDPIIHGTWNITNILASSLPTNSTWNYSVSDTNLGSCWFYTSDNALNRSVDCNSPSINNTNWTTTGSKTITYCVNDTVDHRVCNTSSLTITLATYSQNDDLDPVGEGNNVTYSLQVNVSGMAMPTTSAYLILNNTLFYPTTTAGVGYYNFTYIHKIPDGWGNSTGRLIDWNWNYTIDGLVTNTSTATTNTTVYSVAIDNCTSYGKIILNLSLYDEGSNDFINVTAGSNIELDLSLSKGSMQWNYSHQWTDENNVTVCVPNGLLNNTNYTIDFTIGLDATDHVSEFYYLDNGSLSNYGSSFNSLTNKIITLRDLSTADSTSFLFNYFDLDGLVVDDIIVHTFRKYIGEGVFREVERSKQNNDGNTIVHLVEEDVIYYFIISREGEILFTSNTYTALCQATPCEIQLEESGGFQTFTTDWDLIEGGGYTITTNSASRVVNLTYTLTTPSEMNLTVYKLASDGSYDVVGSDVETSTSGSLVVTVPTVSGNTTFFATLNQDDVFINSQWVDFEEDAGLYFGNTLSLFLGALVILSLGLMAVAEGSAVIIFLALGMFIAMILGVVDYRTSTGASVLIYLILAGGLLIWKLTRRNR